METEVCCICGKECPVDQMKEVEIEGKVKKICPQCATHVHGLI